MAKSPTRANWGCLGLAFVFLAVANVAVFAFTGSDVVSLLPRQVSGGQAWLGSAFFFLLGAFFIAGWVVVKLIRASRQGPGPNPLDRSR